MADKFDAIVLGLGAIGSAALYQLAKRGRKVLGIDQFSPPHNYGSSHGETRIIRRAIGEGEAYVPLVLRSYELWREIENKIGKELLTITGGLTLESQNSEAVMHGRRNFLDQAIGCAKKFNIRHEILETQDIQKRYPQFSVTSERGYFEYDTGFLRPELCVDAQLQLAKSNGASVHADEKVTSISPQENSGVCVQTNGSVYAAESLIVSAGPWISEFMPAAYREYFNVYRQVMYWFDVKEEFRLTFLPGRFPIFIWIFGKGSQFGFYGFPTVDGKTIKLASEQFAVATTPDEVDRAVTRSEEKAMYKNYVMSRIPGLSDVCSGAVSCLYTMTPDANFVIDFHPDNNRIIIASACSGHGFKHSAAIGEVLSELVIDGKSNIDISSFSMKRFL